MFSGRVDAFVDFVRKQTRNFRALLLRDVLGSFSTSVTGDYENLYIRGLGASVTEVGLVRSVSSLAEAATSLPAGLLTDRYNLRRLILVGLALSLVAPLLFLVAGTWQLAIIAVVWSVVVTRISFPALQVAYIDCMEDHARATGMGLFATFRSMVSAVAPLIAAVVVTRFGGIGADGIRPLYLIAFAVAAISLVVIWRGLEDVNVERATERPSTLGFFMDIFKGETAMWQFMALESARQFTVYMANPFFNIYAVEVKHADPYILGWMTVSRMLITVVLALPLGRLSDRIGRKRVVYYFRIFRYATDIGLILAPTPSFLIMVGVFRGIRLVAQDVSYQAFIYELVPLPKRGRWIAVSSLLGGLSGIVATPLGGYLYEHVAPEVPFILLTLFDLCVIMPLFARIPERRVTAPPHST